MERQLRPRKKADDASVSATVKVKKTTSEAKATKVKKTTTSVSTPVKKVPKKPVTVTRKVNKCSVMPRRSLRGKSSPKAAADCGNQSIKKFMTADRDEVNKQIENRRSELRKKKLQDYELEHVFSFEDTEEDNGKLKKTRKKVVKKKPSKEEDKEGVLTMMQVRNLLHMNNNCADKDAIPKPRKFFKTPIEDMKLVVKKEVLWNCNNKVKPKKRAVKSTRTTRPRDKTTGKKPKVTKADEASLEEVKFDETTAEENKITEKKSVAITTKQVNFNQNNSDERYETTVDPVDEAVATKICGAAGQHVSDKISAENDRISLHPQRKTAALSVNPFRKTDIFQKRFTQPQEPSVKSPKILSNQNSVKSRTRAPLGENRTIQNTISPLKILDQSWESKSPEIKFTQQHSIVMSTPHVQNFKSDVISKVNDDIRCGRPPLLAIQKENKILPLKDAKKKSTVGHLDEAVATKTRGPGVHVISNEILSENDRISFHPQRKTAVLSVNPFRKTTIFPKRLAQSSPKISLNPNSIADQSLDAKSPEIKFTQQHGIIMSTPHVQNFKSDVIQKENKVSLVKDSTTHSKCHFDPPTELESQFLENNLGHSNFGGQRSPFRDNRRSKNKILQSSRKHSDDETIYKENVEPSSMANKITVEAVIEAPPRLKEEVTNVIVQRTPLKSLNSSSVPNGKPPTLAFSNEVLDEISTADAATDAAKSKVKDKIRASLFNVDNAFGFDFNQNESMKKPVSKLRQPKLLEVTPNVGYLNNLKHTHSPTVRYLVKEIESIITTKKTKNTSKNKTEDAESQTDDSGSFNESGDQNTTTLNAKEWSNTFDVDSYEQEKEAKEDEVLLFKDVYEPVYFKEPVKYSYTRKRKINFVDEEAEDEDIEPEEKAKVRNKRRKGTKAPKESAEELEWVEKTNKSFEEIDTFDLCVE